MDPVEQFAEEARSYREWALHKIASDADGVRDALLRTTRLYLAALALPPLGETDHLPELDEQQLKAEEQAVLAACARLPIDYYGGVFDPLQIPPEAAVIGSITDDIASVFADVVRGLNYFDAGRPAQATWEWVLAFRSHWGRHATDAIRALHCWLIENTPD